MTWRRNNLITDRNTRLAGGGSFYDGEETVTDTGSCESHKYRVTLRVTGRLPGTYTYTVSNNNTLDPVTSPVFRIQGMHK